MWGWFRPECAVGSRIRRCRRAVRTLVAGPPRCDPLMGWNLLARSRTAANQVPSVNHQARATAVTEPRYFFWAPAVPGCNNHRHIATAIALTDFLAGIWH